MVSSLLMLAKSYYIILVTPNLYNIKMIFYGISFIHRNVKRPSHLASPLYLVKFLCVQCSLKILLLLYSCKKKKQKAKKNHIIAAVTSV